MKLVVLLLLINGSAFAQQESPNFSVTFKDDSLIKIVKDYIRHVKSYDLQPNEAIVVLHSMSAHEDRSEWYFSTFTDIKGLQKSPPVLVIIAEQYPIVVYFHSTDITPLLNYSGDYLSYLEKTIYSKFKKHPNLSSFKLPETWRVIFSKGEKTKVLVAL